MLGVRGLIFQSLSLGEWMPWLPCRIYVQGAGLNHCGLSATMSVFLSFWVNST